VSASLSPARQMVIPLMLPPFFFKPNDYIGRCNPSHTLIAFVLARFCSDRLFLAQPLPTESFLIELSADSTHTDSSDYSSCTFALARAMVLLPPVGLMAFGSVQIPTLRVPLCPLFLPQSPPRCRMQFQRGIYSPSFSQNYTASNLSPSASSMWLGDSCERSPTLTPLFAPYLFSALDNLTGLCPLSRRLFNCCGFFFSPPFPSNPVLSSWNQDVHYQLVSSSCSVQMSSPR